MRILIIGAVGETARHVTRALLAQGHEVTALAGPSPHAFDPDPGLRVARGDARDPRSIERAIRNQDAVISCIGVKARSSMDIQDVFRRNLAAAMRKFDVRRLINLLT
jgi:uncharacterized protein YbjT (DUF2867 family)